MTQTGDREYGQRMFPYWSAVSLMSYIASGISLCCLLSNSFPLSSLCKCPATTPLQFALTTPFKYLLKKKAITWELLPSQHHIYACLMDELNLLPPKGMLCFCSAAQLLSEILLLQFYLIPPAISPSTGLLSRVYKISSSCFNNKTTITKCILRH